MQPKQKPQKTGTAKKVEKQKKETVKKTKTSKKGGSASTLAKLREIGTRARRSDEVEETFGSTGELGGLDGDWDNTEGIDLSKLI